MTLTFLHAADLHIDSPLGGLAMYDGAPEDELRGDVATPNPRRWLTIASEVSLGPLSGRAEPGGQRNDGLCFTPMPQMPQMLGLVPNET